MGQYYKPVIKQNDKITVFSRDVDGNYTMAKLMEHSYFGVPLIDTIAYKMYQEKIQLLWCGDYAEDEEIEITGLKVKDIWSINGEELEGVEFKYNDKYFCNHTQKEYIDFKEYIEKAQDGNWTISPISLLTAIGNGRGGGDYHNGYPNYNEVGSWFWDEISIEDEIPEGYTKNDVVFIEK